MEMNRTFKPAVAALMLAVSFTGSVAAGPLEDAAAAYQRSDYATAIQIWRSLADQGDAKAQTHVGIMYAHSQGVPQDDAAAVIWYRKAAEQGDAIAQTNLGFMYENGRGVTQDYAAAAIWYRKAAEQGNAIAQINLGFMYENGRGSRRTMRSQRDGIVRLRSKATPGLKSRLGWVRVHC
jgi:uncharacterized protein